MYQQECDKLKEKLCEKEGVTLIGIKYNTKMNAESIMETVKEKNPQLHKKILKESIIK